MLRQRLFVYLFFLVFCIACFSNPLNIVAAEKDYWADMGVARIGGKQQVPAPEFTLSALDGKKVSLKDFRGKVVLLNFWATWCPPCVIEMPSIETLNKRLKDKGLVVLAVNYEEGIKKVGSFIKKKGYTFQILLDSDGSAAGNYKTIGFPATYLIDRKGMVIGMAEGARDWASQESFKLIEEISRQ